jgi:hypothetical protein
MADRRRIRLSEDDAMEGGVRCPNCSSYTSFTDVLATSQCRGAWRGDCQTRLWLDLVIECEGEATDVDVEAER